VSSLVWLDAYTPFPDPNGALPDGLLAVGGDLSLARLTAAYAHGIFPWFNEGDPILWWSPDPRMVLEGQALKVSRSLGKKLRQLQQAEAHAAADTSSGSTLQIRLNTAFAAVMQGCAEPRSTQAGTWISPAIQAAYTAWHLAGRAHSVEAWQGERLVGGLYGVSLGGIFFGESMFSRASDASKLALVYLVRYLLRHGVSHIDCQQQTGHLARMGAAPMPRHDFLALLADRLSRSAPPWGTGRLLSDGRLAPSLPKPP